MGSAEGTMSVFAKRLKNERSWCQDGISKFSDVMVALMDGKIIKTMQGELEIGEHTKQQVNNEKPPKHFLEKLTAKAVESSRGNVAYLHQCQLSRP